MNIRLEYSEIEGRLNLVPATEKTNLENEYRTLCSFVNPEQAARFIGAMQEKYPALNFAKGIPFPCFCQLKEELHQFMKEKVQLLEQHMTETFKRRRQLFKK